MGCNASRVPGGGGGGGGGVCVCSSQARKAKLNARLAKASGWNKAPKIAPRSKSSPALRKSVTLPPAKGSRRLSESRATAATAGDAAGPAVGDGGDDTGAWQGAASRNLSSQRRRRRGPLAAQFAVQSRVLGSWAEQERAELRRREKEIRTEQSIRRQRRLQAELERFKANMQPVQPASVPPLSHATLLFWSKHPELNPLRYVVWCAVVQGSSSRAVPYADYACAGMSDLTHSPSPCPCNLRYWSLRRCVSRAVRHAAMDRVD